MSKSILEKNMDELLQLADSRAIAEIAAEVKGVIIPPEQSDAYATAEDIDYVRVNLRAIIEGGVASIQTLKRLADTSESPRAYEVLATIMKTVAEANMNLLTMQKTKAEIESLSGNNGNINNPVVTNNMFVGSTADLQKLLRQLKTG